MKDNNSLSIIIPIYNVPEKLLRKCLDNICLINSIDFEAILVDDGSNEYCSIICDEYSKKCNNILSFHKKNGGLCSARNYGFKISKKKWITFLDGDDWLDSFELLNLFNSIKSNSDIIIFGTIKEYRNSSYKYNFNNIFKEYVSYNNKNWLLNQLLNFNSQIGDSTAKLYNRDFLKKNNLLHDENIRQGVEAIDFNFRCFLCADSVSYVDKNVYHYSYNESSITMNQNSLSYNYLFIGLNKIKKMVLEQNNQELLNQFYNRVIYIIITTAISGIF